MQIHSALSSQNSGTVHIQKIQISWCGKWVLLTPLIYGAHTMNGLLTSAERFSRVKPTANGVFGDVTCQQRRYSKNNYKNDHYKD